MMTVGMPVNTNPTNSKASRPVRLPVRAGDAKVVAIGEIILKEAVAGGNFPADAQRYVVRGNSDRVVHPLDDRNRWVMIRHD